MTQRTADPRTDVECFARILAQLADPFVDASATLREAGFNDRRGWEEIRAAWEGRLAKEPSLRDRFSSAFARGRAGGDQGRSEQRPASYPPSASLLNVPAGSPPPLVSAGVEHLPSLARPSAEPLDVTGEVMPRVAPVLPFSGSSGASVAAAPAAGVRTVIFRENTGTAELAHIDPRRPATPFEKAPSSPPQPEGGDPEEDLDKTTAYAPLPAQDDKGKGSS
jgi:hypothetical protein